MRVILYGIAFYTASVGGGVILVGLWHYVFVLRDLFQGMQLTESSDDETDI